MSLDPIAIFFTFQKVEIVVVVVSLVVFLFASCHTVPFCWQSKFELLKRRKNSCMNSSAVTCRAFNNYFSPSANLHLHNIPAQFCLGHSWISYYCGRCN